MQASSRLFQPGSALVLLGLAPWIWEMSPWFLRGGAMVLWAWVTVTAFQGPGRRLFGSALFILPTLVLIFYSFVGGVFVEWHGGATPIHDPAAFLVEYDRLARIGEPHIPSNMRLAYGSISEFYVLQFAIGLVSLFSFLSSLPERDRPAEASPSFEPWYPLILALAASGIVLVGATDDTWLLSQVRFALTPMAAFSMALVAVWWAGRKHSGVWFVIVTAVVWGAFISHSIKPLAFTFLACIAFVSACRLRSKKQITTIILLLVFFSFTSLTAISSIRGTFFLSDANNNFFNTLRAKIIFRQGETMFCLTSAANKAALMSEDEQRLQPEFFLGVLVPRPVWPEKPNYSSGGDYAVEFCLFPKTHQEKTTHSGSITLFGEPLLHGGPVMLVIVSVVIGVMVGGLAYAQLRGPPVVTAAAIAMTGWLADFDQAASMFIGNAVKAGLVIGGLALVFHLAGELSARARPQTR